MVNRRSQNYLIKYCLGNPNLVSDFFSHDAEKRCKINRAVMEQKFPPSLGHFSTGGVAFSLDEDENTVGCTVS